MSFKLHAVSKVALAAAFLAPAVGSAAPAATLYGGGATLPAIAYVGTSWLDCGGTTCSPAARLTNPADTGSLFGQYSAQIPAKSSKETSFPTVSYCQTGSGGGRNVFKGVVAASAGCGDYSAVPSPEGFSAPGAEPNFAASDAPFAASDYTTFNTNKHATHNEPVQIPSVAGAIAITYNNADVTSQLNVTESQICQIFAGTINNWNQLGAYPSKAITIVVRSDSSGTSFNFSNHLSGVCPSANPTAVTGFSTQSQFSPAAWVGGTVPSNAYTAGGTVGASGNGGVVLAIQATDGAIGYAEAEDAVLRSTLLGSKIAYATVTLQPNIASTVDHPGVTFHKWDPILSLGNRYTIPTGAVKTDEVITGNDANGRPVLGTVASATGITPSQAGCLFIVDPNSIYTAAQKTYTKTNAKGKSITYNEYKGYPIMAVTYLLAYNTGNGADMYNMQQLLVAPYSGTGSNNFRDVTTVGNNVATGGTGTGFQYLIGVPSGFGTLIKNCVKP